MKRNQYAKVITIYFFWISLTTIPTPALFPNTRQHYFLLDRWEYWRILRQPKHMNPGGEILVFWPLGHPLEIQEKVLEWSGLMPSLENTFSPSFSLILRGHNSKSFRRQPGRERSTCCSWGTEQDLLLQPRLPQRVRTAHTACEEFCLVCRVFYVLIQTSCL